MAQTVVVEAPDGPAEVLERWQTPRGELALRRVGPHLEIISNGVFLMDTRNGESERRLVSEALERCAAPAPRILIGGLGVGFSLRTAVGAPHVSTIDVVEIEPAVVAWHATHLRNITGTALDDPRVSIREADLVDVLGAGGDAYDVICLDTDNGPNWLVFDANRGLYTADGLDMLRSRLRSGGVLAVWSASRDEAFERRLARGFGAFDTIEIPVPRGSPDIVYLARCVEDA